VILADDMGWGDLSLNGNTNLKTPHIDSIARTGARFEHFFVQPVCAPTRAEFLTGRYHPRGGVHGVSTGSERLDLDEKTIADAFRAAGYGTGCFGKWHNGSQFPYHPNGRGFDEYYGFTSGHWGEYFDPPLDHNGEEVRGQGYLPDDVTARAIEFMRRTHGAGQPFFCYLAFNTPHSPMQVPEAYWERFTNANLRLGGTKPRLEQLPHTRAALAMCENLDANVGRVIAELRELKIDEDTIVVFFTDNGPNGHRWNGGMKGVKGTTDEGGVRSPLLVRWPPTIRAGLVVEPIAAAIDLYPTLAALAGVPILDEKPLDGADLSPLLRDTQTGQPLPERVLIQHWAGKTSVRSHRHRLDASGRLYDMATDPGQKRDIAEEAASVANELRTVLENWRADVLVELPEEDDRPFPVGFRESSTTILPARDGRPHGGVQRSSSAPNCSYFTNWTSTEDRMTWSIDVAAAGEYEAQVAYTCPPEDVGATVELSCGDARRSGQIRLPHDPPLRGRNQDRTPRQSESYVKDFALVSLGPINLRRGRGSLQLRATNIPGKQVADIQAVKLTHQPLGSAPNRARK
jgi:arylsulfatase A-like enzyme